MQTSIPSTAVPHGGAPASAPAAQVPSAQPGYAAVSWSAVAAGAVTAAALSFILLVLGVGLDWSAISPWSYSAAPLGRRAILWVSFMELASSVVGGYMAGRLRVRWIGVHGDEVYFRDTAHGLQAWAAATLLTAALMAGAIRTALGDAAAAVGGAAALMARQPGAANAGAGAQGSLPGDDKLAAIAKSAGAAHAAVPALPDAAHGYYADLLLRSDAAPAPDAAGVREEVLRILDSQSAALSADDRAYLARLVARRTGLQPSDAERRVDEVTARLAQARTEAQARARAAADEARKAGAYSALWMFFALLLGAFGASVAATFGGRLRDFASPPAAAPASRH